MKIVEADTVLGKKPKNGRTIGQPFPQGIGGCDNFRIPCIVTLNNGTLVASADARWNLEKDGGGSDLVISRSTDGGETWNYSFVGYLGDNGNVWNPNSSTLMDPLLMTDGETLYLLADLFPAGYSISAASTSHVFSDRENAFDEHGNLLLSADGRQNFCYCLQEGKIYKNGQEIKDYFVDGWFHLYRDGTYKTNLFFENSPFQVRATSYIMMMTSKDGGVTWSEPKLLNLKSSGTTWLVLGPGKGLVAKDGTLLFSGYDGAYVYLFFSKDEGETWNRVQTGQADGESQLAELEDGTIRMFVRSLGVNKIQYIDFVWQADTYCAGHLVNTGVDNFSNCMISVIKYFQKIREREVLLVSCPSDASGGMWGGRFKGKIYVFTLDKQNRMHLECEYPIHDGFFAYSCMAQGADASIHLLYEDDCISYGAGNYVGSCSHITYRKLSIL